MKTYLENDIPFSPKVALVEQPHFCVKITQKAHFDSRLLGPVGPSS